MKKQIILMDRPRIERALKRLAIQVWERLGEDNQIILVGLNERGYATASELSKHLEVLFGREEKAYRYNVFGDTPKEKIPDCNDKTVLLVDDVIFSGKTMFSALSSLCNSYEPSRIEIVTLLDRGHRKYPLQTDLTGINIPTKSGEHIEVMLQKGTLEQAILFKNHKS